MNVISKVIRTTAFKLSAIYLTAFLVFAVALVVYIGRNSVSIITEQVEETIRAEVNSLSDQYRLGGIRSLVRTVENRSRLPHASLFLVTDFARNVIAGNIAYLPAEAFEESKGRAMQVVYMPRNANSGTNVITPIDSANLAPSSMDQEAIVRVFELQGGYHVVVGRDTSEAKRFLDMLGQTLRFTVAGMILIALFGWVLIGRRVLKRIKSIAATSRTIMDGDLSGRLQVTGSGDEFDRLAISLNEMLERIEGLMHGLKNVSDNIAHDLKTPLSRLRNRLEAALSENSDVASYRETVEAAIDESDHLIRIFNALLRIARVEAGSHDKDREFIDLASVVREVFDLYEPAVEDEGAKLVIDVIESVNVHSNRGLISQAIINLIDNALKYGKPLDGTECEICVSLSSDAKFANLTVSDNGQGISREDRSKVSKRFVRLEKSRSMPGSGLGLSLVQAVAGFHGGDMILEDNNPGLRVRLRIPRFTIASKGALQKNPEMSGQSADKGAGNDGTDD